MSKILIIATILTVLFSLGLAIWSLFIGPNWILFITSLALAIFFGVFSWHDIRGLINGK